MNRTFRLLVGALLTVIVTGAASAQIQSRPTPGSLPPAQIQAYSQPTAPSYAPAPTYVPQPAFGYPGFPVIQGPAAGYLNGVANVTAAQGQYNKDINQARMMNQQVEQEKMRTRQMLRDQQRYEQSLLPTAQDLKEKDQQEQRRRARNDPPLTEIWSAKSLNDLFSSIVEMETRQGVKGPLIPLETASLQHINLTAGTSTASSSLLRLSGQPKWPLSLQESVFDMERKKIDTLMPQATAEAREGDVQLKTFKALQAAVGELNQKLEKQGPDMALSDIIRAQRYMEELGDAVALLKDPNVNKYFNGAWEARGQSVGELISYMSSNGLRFAPAGENDKQYYTALYRSIAIYENGLTQFVKR